MFWLNLFLKILLLILHKTHEKMLHDSTTVHNSDTRSIVLIPMPLTVFWFLFLKSDKTNRFTEHQAWSTERPTISCCWRNINDITMPGPIHLTVYSYEMRYPAIQFVQFTLFFHHRCAKSWVTSDRGFLLSSSNSKIPLKVHLFNFLELLLNNNVYHCIIII